MDEDRKPERVGLGGVRSVWAEARTPRDYRVSSVSVLCLAVRSRLICPSLAAGLFDTPFPLSEVKAQRPLQPAAFL